MKGAVGILKKAAEGKCLGGGQSLIPVMKLGLATPTDLVSLAGLAEMKVIRIEGKELVIGAGSTHAEVAESAEVRKAVPTLAQLAGHIGDPQVRNRGTLGGSLAHNDPSADYPAAVLALAATVQTDRRKIPADDFFQGMFQTALAADEVVTAVRFPVPERAAYAKFPHPASRFALVGVMVAKGSGGVRVAVTGAGPGVFRWKDSALQAEVLKDYGYSTAAFGKWHNTPANETTVAGPFENWPTGLGFEYFYGFLGGEASQYEPNLVRNTTSVLPPKTPEQGYHLSEDLADDAIHWLRNHKAIQSKKPFYMYWATGAIHGPHEVHEEWADKYKGKFEDGWDAYRERVFKRAKENGWIPADAQLTPRHPAMPSWDSIPEDEKPFQRRLMEVLAGFAEHADAQAGRLIDEIERLGYGDNTLIFYIWGDNGSSGEGQNGTITTRTGERFKRHGQSPATERVHNLPKLRTLCYNRTGWQAAWQGKD